MTDLIGRPQAVDDSPPGPQWRLDSSGQRAMTARRQPSYRRYTFGEMTTGVLRAPPRAPNAGPALAKRPPPPCFGRAAISSFTRCPVACGRNWA